MRDATQQERLEAGQASAAHHNRARSNVVGLGEDRGRDRVLANAGARPSLQARPLRTFGTFFGAFTRLIFRGSVDRVEVDVAESRAGARPRHDVGDTLPHRQNRDGLALQQSTGSIDRRLGINGTVVRDEDQGVRKTM